MDKLGQADRIIADIRIGADLVIEALFVVASQPTRGVSLSSTFSKKMPACIATFRTFDPSGRNWRNLEFLVNRFSHERIFGDCICRWLALKAFTDQKRCFFPHLDDGIETSESASKKRCGSVESTVDHKEEISFLRTLPDILKSLENEVPKLKISTFERLDWLKRASTLTSSINESSMEHNYPGSNKVRLGSVGTVPVEQVAVIELLVLSTFRAVISLHPAGSIDPDAVAFFAPEEVYLAILP